jgi:hypothetical protein
VTGSQRVNLAADILRLRDLDAMLRTCGVSVRRLAIELEVKEKTVHRLLVILRGLVGPTEIVKVPPADGGREGAVYLQKYAGRPKQFFAKFTK